MNVTVSRIVLSHRLYEPGMELLKGKGKIEIAQEGDAGKIMERLSAADAYILRIGRIGREEIQNCKRLKVITRPGVGVDNVDVEAATEYGIPVVICPASNYRAVAEHCLMLLMAVSKNAAESMKETKLGNFSIRNKYAAVDILGKRIAVLGAGKIGKEFARMCTAIGMQAVFYDPYLKEEELPEFPCRLESNLENALAEADYVSLHMPLTEETRHFMGKEQFARMKTGSFFLNCARGGLVDEDALYDALRKGRLAGAGLDVLTQEPMDTGSPLFMLPNTIITPHMAAQTQETTGRIVRMAVEGTLAVLEGKRWEYVCNPQVYEMESYRCKQDM